MSHAQTLAIADLAQHLYDYLPGSSGFRGTFTFAHAATEVGVQPFWPGGSKLPALTSLLERTLAERPQLFCPLMNAIVRGGIKYRAKKGSPLAQEDLDALNVLVERVGFKIPELRDRAFRDRLPVRAVPGTVPSAPPAAPVPRANASRNARLADLRTRFLSLHVQSDRQGAGRTLETLLNDLFSEFDLAPERPFKLIGEQIDGSFVLDSAVYLVEAKWHAARIGMAELSHFRVKVEGKATFTRGLFISVNGYTQEAQEQIVRGKQPNFLMVDGADLYRVFDGSMGLVDLLRRKIRLLAERGRPYVPISELS